MASSPYLPPERIRTVAVIGTGSVGASWAALFLARGMDVVAFDPVAGAPERTNAFITNAWPALLALGLTDLQTWPQERLRFVDNLAQAAREADVVQENTPEVSQTKSDVLRELDAHAAPHKIILSSTGGLSPTSLQAACAQPQRVVVMHPFNPAHLMPLVEVIGGQHTDPAVVAWAVDFAKYVGKEPITLLAEASGHLTNRLQFALVREAISCLMDGLASAQDIDRAVRYGLGPRWTLMGSLLTLHLAGGAGGMKGILDHAGHAMQQWWTPRGPLALTPEVRERLVEAAREVSHGCEIAPWVRWRDQHLVDLIKLQQAGAGSEPK